MNSRADSKQLHTMGGTRLAAEWTIREVLNWTRGYFETAGIVQPRLEAEILLAHALDVDRLHLYLAPDKPLTEAERSTYRSIIKRRHEGVPLQHLIGEVSFFGLRFKVNRNALVPRPETEELLDRVLRMVPREKPVRCLDLGTGSGVLAVCLARYLPHAEVTAVDVSAEALALAKENAALNATNDRVRFIRSDWLAEVDGQFDFIVSNPPYIDRDEIPDLPTEVKDHEPMRALDGGSGGTEQIAGLLSGVRDALVSGGYLLLEIGHDQGDRVRELMLGVGLTGVTVETDLAGKERFAVGQCP